MVRWISGTLLIIAMLVTLPKSQAAMIFDNGLPTGNGITFSDTQAVVFAADDFLLASPSTLDAVRFWGAYANTNTPLTSDNDNFTLRIYSDVAGVIGTVLHTVALGTPTSRVLAGTTSVFTEYRYDDSFLGINLAAGRYWLGITNNTVADADDNWGWSVSGPVGNRFVTSGNPETGPWGNEEAPELAFQLFGTTRVTDAITPVPATLVLGLFALPVLMLRRKR